MDKELVLRMLDFIEKMDAENLALRASLLTVSHSASTAKIDALLKQAIADTAILGTVRAQWLPLRRRIEEDSSLEEALNQFLQIAPLTKDVN